MARIPPKWRGSRDLEIEPGSTVITINASRISFARTYKGPYDKCLEGVPASGSLIANLRGEVARVRVTESIVTKHAGSVGTLAIKAEYVRNWEDQENNPGNEFNGQPELEWVAIERPLLTHPDFVPAGWMGEGAAPLGTGLYRLAEEDVFALDAWENEGDFALRRQFEYHKQAGESVTVQELSTNAKIIAKLKLLGVDGWQDFAPVVRDTVRTRRPPTDGTCGEIHTAAGLRSVVGFRVPPGYEFLKTGDRGTQSESGGRWARQREFTGAKQWNRLLYREAR